MIHDWRVTIPGRLDQVEKICGQVGEAGREAGFDRRTVYACQLAVCEAVENIVKHGYRGERSGEIEARIHVTPGDLTVELLDSAPPFNPAAKRSTPSWNLQDPPVGGLGLIMIHKVMDEVKYRRKRGRNWLLLRKRVRPPSA